MDQELDQLIVVDREDRELNALSKAVCHDGQGVCHRAFSVFIFDGQGRVLIHKRSQFKRLWPEFWSNSCCSHPRWQEPVEKAVTRRVEEELGMSLSALSFVYKFEYHASFGEVGSEWEICHVFLARSRSEVKPEPTEIEAWQWVEPHDLGKEIRENPDRFTPWMKMEWEHLQNHKLVEPYLRNTESGADSV